jgi:hypothetical protein
MLYKVINKNKDTLITNFKQNWPDPTDVTGE